MSGELYNQVPRLNQRNANCPEQAARIFPIPILVQYTPWRIITDLCRVWPDVDGEVPRDAEVTKNAWGEEGFRER